jgi:hypothetical protein
MVARACWREGKSAIFRVPGRRSYRVIRSNWPSPSGPDGTGPSLTFSPAEENSLLILRR